MQKAIILNIIRKILPKRVRNLLGAGADALCHRSPVLAIPIAFFLHGTIMRPVGMTFEIRMEGLTILVPKRGWRPFFEVFHDQIYERFFGVSQGDVVIDIGAHVGVFTLKVAKAVGEKGQVVAIEPEPGNLALLRRNIVSNGIRNVIVIDKAVSSHKTKAKLNLSDESASHSLLQPLFYPSSNYIEVEADSLDNIVLETGLSHVDFIKIDAEGSELEILKGAEKTLQYPNVKLSISAYHVLEDGTPEFPQIMSFLTERRFKIYTSNNQFIYAVGRFRRKQAHLQATVERNTK